MENRTPKKQNEQHAKSGIVKEYGTPTTTEGHHCEGSKKDGQLCQLPARMVFIDDENLQHWFCSSHFNKFADAHNAARGESIL
jgi:hypothetical protein